MKNKNLKIKLEILKYTDKRLWIIKTKQKIKL